MAFVFMILVYLSLPIIELAAIIFLAASRSYYKNRVRELEQKGLKPEQRTEAVPAAKAQTNPVTDEKERGNLQPENLPVFPKQEADEAYPPEGSVKPAESAAYPSDPPAQQAQSPACQSERTAPPAQSPAGPARRPATAAKERNVMIIPFVVGVIFVILAGLIFATTTWSILPPISKAGMVLILTVLFFTASLIAEKKLQLEATGKAFYILGSMFLFVTTVAFGYFRILGPNLVPGGEASGWLYFLGLLFTETACIWGLNRFKERLYSLFCLYGITVVWSVFLLALKLSLEGFAMGMAAFACGMIFVDKGRLSLPKRFSGLKEAYFSYRIINLWLVSVIVLIGNGFSILSGLAAFLVGMTHLYCGSQKEKGDGEAVLFSICFVIGTMKILAPDEFDNWMYLCCLTMLLLTVLNTFGFFGSKMNRGFETVHWVQAVASLMLPLVSPLLNFEVTASSLICMGILLADVSITAWKNKTPFFLAAHSAVLVIFVIFGAFYPEMAFQFRLFLITAVLGFFMLLTKTGHYPYKSFAGQIIFTTVISMNVLLILLLRFIDVYEPDSVFIYFPAETAMVFIVSAIIWSWEKSWKKEIVLSPLVLSLWLISLNSLAELFMDGPLPYDWFLFAYLVLLCVAGLWGKQKDYRISAFIFSVFSTAVCFHAKGVNMPFLVCISIYLLAKGGEQYFYTGCVSGLLGLVLVIQGYTEDFTLCLMVPFAILAAFDFAYESSQKRSLSCFPEAFRKLPVFAPPALTLLYVLASLDFYTNSGYDVRYLLLLVPAFFWICRVCRRENNTWFHLASSAVTLGFPAVLLIRYEINSDVVYTGTLLGLAVITAVSRKILPLWEEKGKNADWFSILQILLLIFLAVFAEQEEWRFASVVCMAGYALQYGVYKPWRKGAVTAACLVSCAAFWIQPFIPWPKLLSLEICLLPVATTALCLNIIWGKSKTVFNAQTGIVIFCLVLLFSDALRTGQVWDALILEGICLTMMVVSYSKKSGRFVKLSGAAALGTAVYVTRGFWLSLSWWIYLLAAGIGLIFFAAYHELKKH